jgi:hypothetical protein
MVYFLVVSDCGSVQILLNGQTKPLDVNINLKGIRNLKIFRN